MSPVSRGRKDAKPRRPKPSTSRPLPPLRLVGDVPRDVREPVDCDCPACTDPAFDPQSVIGDLIAEATEVLGAEDPIDAELLGATFLAIGGRDGEAFDEALTRGIVPAMVATGRPEGLALLLALDATGLNPAPGQAARQLVAAGVPEPSWAAELRTDLRMVECRQLVDPEGSGSVLLGAFERAGRRHGFVVEVDDGHCHEAVGVQAVPGEAWDEVVAAIVAEAGKAGVVPQELAPEEFRWRAERALDARDVHDRQDGWSRDDGEESEGFPGLAVLLRARLRTLPEPLRPPERHGDGDVDPGFSVADLLAQLAGRSESSRGRRSGSAKLPPKRKKSDGPAPIYQVKVSLRGAKPPIWRRLELPADTSLAALHDIVQTAFGWDDSHLHVFETEYGEFGTPDPQLGHRSERPVTLEQVAPAAGAKLRYRYDFGDDWAHDIVVEKVLERAPVAYPRCTGGRRAGPPEDCGGVWGYQNMIEVLADPDHPEHEDQVEWLGLEKAADFQPDRFSAAEINELLTGRP